MLTPQGPLQSLGCLQLLWGWRNVNSPCPRLPLAQPSVPHVSLCSPSLGGRAPHRKPIMGPTSRASAASPRPAVVARVSPRIVGREERIGALGRRRLGSAWRVRGWGGISSASAATPRTGRAPRAAPSPSSAPSSTATALSAVASTFTVEAPFVSFAATGTAIHALFTSAAASAPAHAHAASVLAVPVVTSSRLFSWHSQTSASSGPAAATASITAAFPAMQTSAKGMSGPTCCLAVSALPSVDTAAATAAASSSISSVGVGGFIC